VGEVGETVELRATGNAKFAIDLGEVELDRPPCDAELLGYLAVGSAVDGHADEPVLVRRQRCRAEIRPQPRRPVRGGPDSRRRRRHAAHLGQ